MYETIPKNSTVAALRRTYFTLVDSTDLITPKDITVTGQKPTLSFNGGTPATATNDIVKVNGATGEYYHELTQTESNTALGIVRGWITPTGCALTKLQATIGPLESYDSPATSLPVSTGGLSAGSFASDATALVKQQVTDALGVDTYAEPTAVPGATSTLAAKIGYVFTKARNKILETATSQTLRNNGDTANISSSTLSDDGTTFTKTQDT